MTAPINDRVRENLEASFIALSRPSLNETEIDARKLILKRCYMAIFFFNL